MRSKPHPLDKIIGRIQTATNIVEHNLCHLQFKNLDQDIVEGLDATEDFQDWSTAQALEEDDRVNSTMKKVILQTCLACTGKAVTLSYVISLSVIH